MDELFDSGNYFDERDLVAVDRRVRDYRNNIIDKEKKELDQNNSLGNLDAHGVTSARLKDAEKLEDNPFK